MKELRFLLLGLVICLASGVKAQFYDSADEICYYVEYKDGSFVDDGNVRVFNFDGETGAVLNQTYIDDDGDGPFLMTVNKIKNKFKEDPGYFETKVETTDYNMKYVSSSTYFWKMTYRYMGTRTVNFTFKFSSGRDYLYEKEDGRSDTTYKKVQKSYFKVGRSRTPSSTMHE